MSAILEYPPNAYHRQYSIECWLYRKGRDSDLSSHICSASCCLVGQCCLVRHQCHRLTCSATQARHRFVLWFEASLFLILVPICLHSEWYGYHFPELVKIVPDNSMYCRLAQLIGNRKELSEESLASLEEVVMDSAKAQAILDASRSSMGQQKPIFSFRHKIVVRTLIITPIIQLWQLLPPTCTSPPFCSSWTNNCPWW